MRPTRGLCGDGCCRTLRAEVIKPSAGAPEHLLENVAALRVPLPDRDMRVRMVRCMETIPGFDKPDRMTWYPEKTYPGVIGRAQRELRSRA